MSNISLTASMRSNLLSLQQTAALMDQTQERLSTGKKVNSAIDNPSAYYTAQSLTNRAGDLGGLLDSMGQAISTIKAADEGIEAITSFAEQAKAVATSALDTKDVAERATYMKQFNEIREQINKLAKDSGYKGVNLINGDDLSVTFNEDRSSKLEIKGQDATTTGLGIGAGAGWYGTKIETASIAEFDSSGAAVAAGTKVKVGSDYYIVDQEIAKGADFDAAKATKLVKVGEEYFGPVVEADDKAIETAVNAATDAINKLRTMSSELGNNYSIVETRESFTENLVNVLEEGADKLTLADMNEESANMLALQTRQQLAINSLSLASQASQSVLSLF